MRHLTVLVLARNERAVLRALGRLGNVHFTRTEAVTENIPVVACDHHSEVARCDRLLSRVDDVIKALGLTKLEPGLPSGSFEAVAEVEIFLGSLEQRLRELIGRRQCLSQREEELTAIRKRVSNYRELEIPKELSLPSSLLHFVTGTLPPENLGKLEDCVGPAAAIFPLEPQDGRQPVIAMSTRDGHAALEQALRQAGFEAQELSLSPGESPAGLWRNCEREMGQVRAEQESVSRTLQALGREAAIPLAAISRFVRQEKSLLQVREHFAATGETVLLTGWVPTSEVPSVVQSLRDVTRDRCLINHAGPESLLRVEAPVLLRHRSLIRPFELLVSAYGLPRYEELEPTVFVAVSYLLMFGMMFGDVGHGAVLALGGLVAWLVAKRPRVRDAGFLLVSGGLSSMVFGVVYGSCFGLAQFKKYALWHDPLEGSPLVLMGSAVGIGVVILSAGLVLNIINRFHRGDFIGGFLDRFGVTGILFYWGSLFLITKMAAIQSRGLIVPVLLLFVVLPLSAWVLHKPVHDALRHKAGYRESFGRLLSTLPESFLGAFEAVLSYLANTISFVRLAAYAMSHAALLLAAFTMAGEVKHLSFGGDFLGMLIIIIGNVLAILLEGIIASVQALRLEYYEFFSKFFSGSGQPFNPFRIIEDERLPGTGMTGAVRPSR